MGENEHGGMLRTVVVIGIIAMIAIVITVGVVRLNSNVNKNTNRALGVVAMTKVPYDVDKADVHYTTYPPLTNNRNLGENRVTFPRIGTIPPNSWREDRLVVESDKRVWIKMDINTNYKVSQPVNNYDAVAYRQLLIYNSNGDLIKKANDAEMMSGKIYLEKDTEYILVVKYYNDKGVDLVEDPKKADWKDLSMLYSGPDDSSSYHFQVKNFEAATYNNKYVQS